MKKGAILLLVVAALVMAGGAGGDQTVPVRHHTDQPLQRHGQDPHIIGQ